MENLEKCNILEAKIEELNSALFSVSEKHHIEKQEKDHLISQCTERIGQLEEANRSMEEMLHNYLYFHLFLSV
jgi:hypothetical protein